MPLVQLGNPVPQQPRPQSRRPNLATQRPGGPAALSAPTAPITNPLEQPRGGFFYPRIIFGGGSQLDFLVPADPVVSEGRVYADNVSLTGYQERLSVRLEPRLTLAFKILHPTNLAQVRAWWIDWASLGRQSQIILDRFGTCAGQYEFDNFNTTFTRAHCLYNPFEPRHFVPSRGLFSMQLSFRQGQDEALVP